MKTTKLGTICFSVNEVDGVWVVSNADGEFIEQFATIGEANKYANDMEERMVGIINNRVNEE